jgi:hypothetical protein
MKIEKLEKKMDQLRLAASKLVKDLLVPSTSVYFCDIDGSVDFSEAWKRLKSGEKLTLSMDIEKWPEHTRTMTESGRRQLAKEAAARDRLIAWAVRLGFGIEVVGNGAGSNGPVNCYELRF